MLNKKIHLLFIFTFSCFIPIQSWSQNIAPTLTATGNQYYCPQNRMNVVTDFNIVDPDDTGIEAVFVQISTGYTNGEDSLSLDLTSHPNLTTSWSSSEGKLTIKSNTSGDALYSDLIVAVKNVVYESTSANPTVEKKFSITIGDANYLPLTEHFYEYIDAPGITWENAKTAAEGKTYFELQGYLATITSAEEAQICGEQATGQGWIGGSDKETEGIWKWVTGPEAGKTFFFSDPNGISEGGTSVGAYFSYTNWNINEPNDWVPLGSTNGIGNENYAHVYGNGKWNDYPNINGSITGYVVEYGDTPGDPILKISASTSIKMMYITDVTENSTCGSGTVDLSATSNFGNILWFDTATSTTPIATTTSGNDFTTPMLNATTKYYALASTNGCTDGERRAVTATFYTIPTINSTTGTIICESGTGILNAVASAGEINWYASSIGGIPLGTGTSFTPSSTVSSTTTYYVDATENGCTTTNRTGVVLNVQYTNPPTATSPQTFCDIDNATISNLTVVENNVQWYANSLGGTPLNATDLLTNGTNYYATQTVNGCESPTRLAVNVLVYETVIPSAIIPLEECDNNSFGSDTDGIVIVDLTQKETEILAGQNPNDYSFSYFSDNTYTASIPNPIAFKNSTAGGQTIYVRVSNNSKNTCFTNTFFELKVNALPTISSIVELKQCDDDTDGISLFNLTEANTLISVNHLTEDITYYLTEAEALNGLVTDQITNFINYPNPIPLNDIVFARIENADVCFRTAQIDLVVGVSQIPPTFVTLEYTVCDDELIDGDKRNGIATFDFSDAEQTIKNLFPLPHDFTVKFYNNELDALAETNPIPDPSNHRNDGYPNTQNIYVRIDSDNVNACLGLGHHITLNVESLPTANPVTFARQCDDIPTDTELSSEFDTSGLEADLLLSQSNVSVTYFHADGTPLTDLNGNPINSPFPDLFRTISQTITARVVNNITNTNNNTACDDSTTIEFIIDTSPVVNPVTFAPACDDGVDDTDGFHEFDTSSIEATLLGGQTGMNVIYTDGTGSVLSSPLPNPFNSGTQTISVAIENPINNSCVANTTIDFIVNSLPEFTVESPQIVCLNGPVKTLTFDTELEAYTYDWTDENGLVANNSPSIDVSSGGIYTITATNSNNCTRSLTIEVNESIIATITMEDVTITDDSDNNTITINTTNLGIGAYEFSLDDFNYQNEPVFENVEAGIYNLFVNDKNGCGTTDPLQVSVIGYPKFFTPNNDGFNDTWQVLGVSSQFYPTSLIYIFDRFGKLITTVDPTSDGWNGLYNNEVLPATDYWFTAQLIDENGGIREKKGHFSLIR